MVRRLRGFPALAMAIGLALPAIGCGESASTATPAAASADDLPGLIRGLKNKSPTARARTARRIGDMGPDARDAVPALTAALKDRDPAARAAAAYALGRIGPDSKAALPQLEAMARKAVTEQVATEAIKRIGGGTEAAAVD